VKGTCPKCKYEAARGDECGKCGASFEAIDLINPVSKLTDAPLVLKPTKHWFLKLDLFKDKLSTWLSKKDWKNNVLKFIQNYVDDLRPRAITRDGSWGVPIPLPNTEGKVLYVWFDAPIGYISIAKEWAASQGDPDLWKKYWCDDKTSLVQFVGKDNIPFHAAFFPAMTMGQNQPYKLVDELPANEFYLLEGRQFSKSDGWFIDLPSFFQNFTSDQIRYTIAANAPENHDSEFTWKDFAKRCNGDLLGKYGNFVNRTLVFVKNKYEGKVPPEHALQPIDQAFLDKTKELNSAIKAAYQSFQLRKASQLIMELAAEANTYFDAKKPWHSFKQESTRADTDTTLHLCLLAVQLLALVSFPIIPQTAEKIWFFLNLSPALAKQRWDHLPSLPAGHLLSEPAHLFQKIEDTLIDSEMEKLVHLGVVKQ
jgi:methionyl-tRNA synthetase